MVLRGNTGVVEVLAGNVVVDILGPLGRFSDTYLTVRDDLYGMFKKRLSFAHRALTGKLKIRQSAAGADILNRHPDLQTDINFGRKK